MVRLYSNETDLDLGDVSTTLTFSIADIREPDKRNAAFSKTLTLPGTKTNNLFFEHIFEVNIVTQTFNPNQKARTILSVDGVTQFKGALKLRQVNYLLSGEVTYDCNLIGNLSDFIQTLGTSTLRDLDLSAFNHEFSKTSIENSWTPTLGTGYVYPMMNYGTITDLTTWDVGYFRPAPFAKTVLDRIFTEAGFSYSSSFLASDLFKRLIIPNSNDKLRLTGTQINARLFNAGRATAQTFTDTNYGIGTVFYTETTLQVNDDSTGQYFDNDASFNTALFWHEPSYNGTSTYTLSCDVELSVTKDVGDAGFGYDLGGGMTAIIMRERSGVLTQMNSFFLDLSGVAASPAGTYTLSGTIDVAAENCDIATGDRYYVMLKHAVVALFNPTSIQWSVDNISFRNTVVNDVITYGDTVVLSYSLPDMLQKDFVMGIAKMFNLYLEPDADNEETLNIEPRDDYYTSTQVDWSAKLDTSKDLEIEPMALLNFKRLICSYKSDDDYYNKMYKGEYARVYGDYTEDIDNDFVNGEYKVETNFAPTPLVGNYENDRVIPTLFTSNGTPPVMENKAGLPRILYWGGLKNCEQWNFRYFSQNNYKAQYPYAGHLDDVQSPTIDLSFGVPLKVYYGINQFITSLTYTDNNLYNGYYKQMIDEVTDRDSKLVTGYFWLNPVDILSLDFSKVYRVGRMALRLNKVYDYNPLKPSVTKCEFIKIKDVNSFAPSGGAMNGGIGIVINSKEDTPVIDLGTWQNGNVMTRPSSTVITGEKNYAGSGLSFDIHGKKNRVHGKDSSGVAIWGEDNTVQAASSGVAIFGYQNTVGFNSKNIFIHGKNNVINPEKSNVALINTNNETVSEDSVTYINGNKVYDDTVFTRETGWAYSNNKNLFTSPNQISELAAQADKIILIKELLFCLDAGGTQYNFANNLKLRYTGGNVIVDIDKAIVNSATDYFYHYTAIDAKMAIGEGIELYSAADAAAGNGLYYYKMIYEIITKPF